MTNNVNKNDSKQLLIFLGAVVGTGFLLMKKAGTIEPPIELPVNTIIIHVDGHDKALDCTGDYLDPEPLEGATVYIYDNLGELVETLTTNNDGNAFSDKSLYEENIYYNFQTSKYGWQGLDIEGPGTSNSKRFALPLEEVQLDLYIICVSLEIPVA